MVQINLADPGTFFVLVVLAALVVLGFFLFMREVVASGMDLHEERKELRERQKRRSRRDL